ncbi:hypothetical protein GGR57DRAFT_4852 [Xylariaceae sp. FL1272]|nr:hypothetical protein GGR57DRAFT_4852 [Xylariaceae sp. FL1272]
MPYVSKEENIKIVFDIQTHRHDIFAALTNHSDSDQTSPVTGDKYPSELKMMMIKVAAALMGVAVPAVFAQDHQSGPFYLKITGQDADSSISGYGSSCHTGAAIEGLCYGTAAPEGSEYGEYYFNYTGYTKVDDNDVGYITWNLPYNSGNGTTLHVSQAMGLTFQVNSNVAEPQFGFNNYFNVGFDEDDKLFAYAYYDDATFEAGQFPTTTEGTAWSV